MNSIFMSPFPKSETMIPTVCTAKNTRKTSLATKSLNFTLRQELSSKTAGRRWNWALQVVQCENANPSCTEGRENQHSLLLRESPLEVTAMQVYTFIRTKTTVTLTERQWSRHERWTNCWVPLHMHGDISSSSTELNKSH